MTNVTTLPYHVFDDLNTLRGRFLFAVDAAAFVASLTNGATVMSFHRNGASRTLWTEGTEPSGPPSTVGHIILARWKMSAEAFAQDWLNRHDASMV